MIDSGSVDLNGVDNCYKQASSFPLRPRLVNWKIQSYGPIITGTHAMSRVEPKNVSVTGVTDYSQSGEPEIDISYPNAVRVDVQESDTSLLSRLWSLVTTLHGIRDKLTLRLMSGASTVNAEKSR